GAARRPVCDHALRARHWRWRGSSGGGPPPANPRERSGSTGSDRSPRRRSPPTPPQSPNKRTTAVGPDARAAVLGDGCRPTLFSDQCRRRGYGCNACNGRNYRPSPLGLAGTDATLNDVRRERRRHGNRPTQRHTRTGDGTHAQCSFWPTGGYPVTGGGTLQLALADNTHCYVVSYHRLCGAYSRFRFSLAGNKGAGSGSDL